MALEEDNKPRFATDLNVGGNQIITATGAAAFDSDTNTVVVFTAGPKGSLVDSCRIITDDTVNKVVLLQMKDNLGGYHPLGVFTVPLASGTNGTALPFDPLSNANASHHPITNQGKRQWRVPAGWTIIAGVQSAMTAAKKLWVECSGLDFEA